MNYIEVNGIPVKVSDPVKWAQQFETADRVVAKTKKGRVEVSTVFLGIDHSFGWGRVPVLYETMVFGGRYDQRTIRYCTREEAETGHRKMCALVFRLVVKRRP